jgi:mannose-6-phosphate isomerase-like protein (cupin superfamily)
MHPAGDEVIVLVSGQVDLILDDNDDGIGRLVRLDRVGACAVIPRGVWHTARTTGCSLLFITPGKGTDHRPLSLSP